MKIMGSFGQGNESDAFSLKMYIWEKLEYDIYSIGRYLFLIVLFLWENESTKLKLSIYFIFVFILPTVNRHPCCLVWLNLITQFSVSKALN